MIGQTMEATMTLDEARRVLKEGPKPGAENYVRHATASAVIYMNHQMQHGHMTRDAVPVDRPGRIHDQPLYQPFQKARSEEVRPMKLNESWATIVGPNVPNPGKEVGGELVMRLPGALSSYYLAVDETTQQPAVFRYALPQVTVAKGAVTTDRGPSYYAGLRRRANVARELSGVQLKSINRQHKEFWERRNG
jgi:hypothetical protein